MAAVEHTLGDRVEQAEGRHHGARRQHFDLELAAGHVVDLLGVVECVFVENVLGRQVLCQRMLIGPVCAIAAGAATVAAAAVPAAAVFKKPRRDVRLSLVGLVIVSLP